MIVQKVRYLDVLKCPAPEELDLRLSDGHGGGAQSGEGICGVVSGGAGARAMARRERGTVRQRSAVLEEPPPLPQP